MTESQIPIGAQVLSADGLLLGLVGTTYVDKATGVTAWVSVTGPGRTAVVPVERSRFEGQILRVPFSAEQVMTAPHHDPSGVISYPDGDDLARHYGLIPAENGMVLSREQIRAGAVNVAVGRARLVTYIVTEEQTFTIPVSRQEVRLVIDPIPVREQVVTDVAPAEETYDVIRYAEQVSFTKTVVPIERVRLTRRVVTVEQTVTTEVRSEQIDLSHTGIPTSGEPTCAQ